LPRHGFSSGKPLLAKISFTQRVNFIRQRWISSPQGDFTNFDLSPTNQNLMWTNQFLCDIITKKESCL
jgi:hypothetical protein